MSPQLDSSLIDRCAHRDSDAWQTLAAMLESIGRSPTLRLLVARHHRDPNDADDLLQDILADLWERSGSPLQGCRADTPQGLIAFIRAFVRDRVRNQLRGGQRAQRRECRAIARAGGSRRVETRAARHRTTPTYRHVSESELLARIADLASTLTARDAELITFLIAPAGILSTDAMGRSTSDSGGSARTQRRERQKLYQKCVAWQRDE